MKNNSTNKETNKSIFDKLIKLIKSFKGIPDTDISDELSQLIMFFNSFENLTRKQIYDILEKIYTIELSEYQQIILWDFESGIVGDVDESCIKRYYGEENFTQKELTNFVRSKKWLK